MTYINTLLTEETSVSLMFYLDGNFNKKLNTKLHLDRVVGCLR